MIMICQHYLSHGKLFTEGGCMCYPLILSDRKLPTDGVRMYFSQINIFRGPKIYQNLSTPLLHMCRF